MIILVGPSASGKTEVATYLKERYGLKRVITHTTRNKRRGEVDDIDYHFVSEDKFLSLMKDGAFVETTVYNNHHYGTSKKEILPNRVLVVDPNGLKAFLALENKDIVSFLLIASEKSRATRMRNRGDNKEAIKSRLENDKNSFDIEDLKRITNFQIVTDNIPIEKVGDEVMKLYKSK